MSTDLTEIKMTYFGQAAYYFAYDLISRVTQAVTTWNPAHDYTRVVLPNYFETFTLSNTSGIEKKYHYHKLLYGPMKTIHGKDVFKMRTDDEAFWLSQWGIEYSPFRIVQKILKDNGLYLVDHTFGGQTPFVYVYKHLPPRSVIKNIPWHDYHNIPDLNEKDFCSPKLTPAQIATANLHACVQLQAQLAHFTLSMMNTSYIIGVPSAGVITTQFVPSEARVAHPPSNVRSYRDAAAHAPTSA